jgi:hypothetical protein
MGRRDATIDCRRGAISGRGRDRQGPVRIGDDGGRVLDLKREPEQVIESQLSRRGRRVLATPAWILALARRAAECAAGLAVARDLGAARGQDFESELKPLTS